jgi:chromosomal replication initiator protein
MTYINKMTCNTTTFKTLIIPSLPISPIRVKSNKPLIHISPDEIINIVVNYFDISKINILSASRKRMYSDPRAIAMTLLYSLTMETKVSIGKIFNRDHSTVCYAIEKVNNLLDYDKAFIKDFERIQAKIKGVIENKY